MLNLHKALALIAKSLDIKFTLHNREIAPDEAFKEHALFPAIFKRADQLCSFCLGHGLGVSFDEHPGTMLGVLAKFDQSVSNSLRIMCATEILYEVIESSPDPKNVALDNLMYD